MIERIKSCDDPKLIYFSSLTDAQLMHYPSGSNGMFIAESRLVAERALNSGAKPVCMFVEDRWIEQSRDLAKRILDIDADIPVLQATHEQMQKITGYQVTRGALVAFERPPLAPLEDVLKGAHRVAVLEGITNFTNIGAIFRSAAALGTDAVLITPGCHDPLYKRASRVSMGTVFQVPWTRIDDVAQLNEYGFSTAALALSESAISIEDSSLQRVEKLAMVLGSEGDGLSSKTISQCDYVVRIPMEHGVDSLNVAAASAVAFWELRWRGAAW